MNSDIKAIKAYDALPSNSTSASSTTATGAHNATATAVSYDSYDWDCDYVEYSTVPDQTGGPFWSILNRIFLVFACLLLGMSEVGIPRRLFEEAVPVLGPAHGLGCLGVFECL
jgi:hypothetical protein